MQVNQPLAVELAKLRAFGRFNVYGARIVCGAFGDPYQDGLDPGAHDYHFSIEEIDGALKLTVDAYSAKGEHTADTWDVDAWEDQMIELVAHPISRDAFRVLSAVGRGLLTGRAARLSDGTLIPAIVRVAQ